MESAIKVYMVHFYVRRGENIKRNHRIVLVIYMTQNQQNYIYKCASHSEAHGQEPNQINRSLKTLLFKKMKAW